MGKIKHNINTVLKRPPKMKDYPSLPEEVIKFLETITVKPNDCLKVKKKQIKPIVSDLWAMKWIDLISLRKNLEEGNLEEVLKSIYQVSTREILEIEIISFLSSLKWISNQLEEMAEAEAENLDYKSTVEEQEAGVEELQKYEYYVTLDSLTNGDSTKEDFYLNKEYSFIFRKLCLINDRRNITDKIQEIVSRKNKRS